MRYYRSHRRSWPSWILTWAEIVRRVESRWARHRSALVALVALCCAGCDTARRDDASDGWRTVIVLRDAGPIVTQDVVSEEQITAYPRVGDIMKFRVMPMLAPPPGHEREPVGEVETKAHVLARSGGSDWKSARAVQGIGVVRE